MHTFLDYDPNRLVLTMPSLDRVRAAAQFLEKKAQHFEERAMKPSPIFLQEVVAALSKNEVPSYKAMKRVAAGGLPDLLARVNGESLLSKFVYRLIEFGSRVLYKALLLGYLRLGNHGGTISELVRKTLVGAKQYLPARWVGRIDEFGLLDSLAGKKLATMSLHSTGRLPLEIFEAAGLKRGVLLGGGFAFNAFVEMCKEISKGHAGERLERFFSMLPDPTLTTDDGRKLLCVNAVTHVAKALLTPYLQADPDEATKLKIVDTLIRLYEDPQLNPGAWANVDQDLLDLMYRWLTEESFELLMKVLNSSNQSLQWKNREKFWRRYLKKGFIKEAWVALGPDAKRQAEKLIRSQKLRSKGSFGVLEKSQIQGHHSVLFMRIGDLTISEWTHDGKVRFYRSSNKNKPTLYRPRYDPDVIRGDGNTDHFKVHLGYWEQDVASYIRDVTGLRAL